jgi:hypothetical protein
MKNINEITPSDYHSFYLSPYPAPFDVKVNTSLGFVDSPDCDLVDNDGQVLVAYKTPQVGYHNNIILKDGTERPVQLCTYEDVFDILNQEYDEYSNFFVFLDSAVVPSKDSDKPSLDAEHKILGQALPRCDYEKFGVSPFYPNKAAAQNISRIRNVLDISGVGHVLFINTLDVEKKTSHPQVMNTVTRTLTGLIKTIFEWSIVNEDPFNNQERISARAKEFLNKLNIPENIIKEINDNQPDMKVATYLKGETVNNYAIDENNFLPNSFADWYKSKIRYRTLNSLVKNNPIDINIDSSILEKEKRGLESIIYSFCIINNIDYTNIGMTDLLNLMMSNRKTNVYQNLSESIDSVQKYIHI